LVGIAGGIHQDLRLGDVVISSEIVYYEKRKTTDRAVLRRGDAKPIPARATQLINAFFTEHQEPASFSDDNGAFYVRRGPVGSGEAVVASSRSDIRDYLAHYNDKTLALETEAGGVAQAFYETVGDRSSVIAWFTLRGISDMADEAKDDSFHDIAAQRAAAVLEKMMPFLATSSGR
jgi:adenosylhomocysteine nucleosidase